MKTTVRAQIQDQNQDPVPGAVLTVELTRAEVDDGYVVPFSTQFEADEAGVCDFEVWPNERGVTGSQYRVTAVDPRNGRRLFRVFATVPDMGFVYLQDVASEPPYPAVSEAQKATEDAQLAALEAKAWASKAIDSEVETGLYSARHYAHYSDLAAQAAVSARNDAQTAQGAAETAQTGAVAAQTAAETAQSGAETAETAADGHRAAAESAELGATQARDAAEGHAANADQHRLSALGYRDEAQDARDLANTYAGQAQTHKNDAQTAASNAATSETNAADSALAAASAESGAESARDAAQLSEANAATSETNSAASESKAQQWAENPEDQEVEPGAYSAKHWATKAEQLATGVLRYQGGWDPNSGAYPADPTEGDFYRVSADGTHDGINFWAGDQIIYNGVGWDHYEVGDVVTSWAGKTGNIDPQIGDISGLQAALDGKSDTGHAHDDRYYTEAEVDSFLAGKSNTGHTHDDRYYTEAEMDTLLSQRVPETRTLTAGSYLSGGGNLTANRSFAVDISSLNADIAPVWGNFTGTLSNQTDLQNALDGKSNTGHTHTLSDITDSGTAAGRDIGTSSGDVMERTSNGLGGFGYGGECANPPNNDLNDATLSGWYRISSQTTNKPSAFNNGIVRSEVRVFPNRVHQTAYQVDGSSNRSVWIRHSYGSTPSWTQWEELYHTANLNPLEESDRDTNGGTVITGQPVPSDYWSNSAAMFTNYGYLGTNGAFALSLLWNGYRNSSGGWTSLGVDGESAGAGIDINESGIRFMFEDPVSGTFPTIRGRFASDGGFLMEGATGGSQGAGTINAEELYENGNRVATLSSNIFSGSQYIQNSAGLRLDDGSGGDEWRIRTTATLLRLTAWDGAAGNAWEFDGANSVFTAIGKTHLNGEIMGSNAALQVNGFSRMGQIYLHEGGSTPTTTNKLLRNQSGLLQWDAETLATRNWVNDQGFGGASNLNELSDVILSSVASNDTLQFDGSNWVNRDPASARSGLGLGSMATRNQGTGGSQHRTNTQNDNRFPQKQSTTESLGGDFNAAQYVTISKHDNKVTITSHGILGHSSGGTINSATGVVPSAYRPAHSMSNVYESFGGSQLGLFRVGVQSNGTITLSYRDGSGSSVSRTDTGSAFSITYEIT